MSKTTVYTPASFSAEQDAIRKAMPWQEDKAQRLHSASARQFEAMNPTRSIWLSASAGTGKTYVLVRRVLALLLHDPSLNPGSILALTFTRAAAREMEGRLLAVLTAWCQVDDATLKAEVSTLLQRPAEAEDIAVARRLLSRVVDANPPLTLTTLHAFAQKVLGRFTLETELWPGFEVIEEDVKTQLFDSAVDKALNQLGTGAVPHWAFDVLAERLAESSMKEAFSSFLGQADRYKRLFERHQGVENTLQVLAEYLSLPHGEMDQLTLELENQIAAPTAPKDELLALAALWQTGGKQTVTAGTMMEAFWRAPASERVALWQRYQDVYFTQKGEKRARLADKATQAKMDEAAFELLEEEIERIEQVQAFEKALRSYKQTAAYLLMSSLVLHHYEAAKKHRGLLDFDDLINAVAALFQKADQKAWVLYRMDASLKHIMVDEAQDTDRTQWQIVQALLDDFYAGEGQHEALGEAEAAPARTYFAVGDMKQSIYRFRGAEPDVFLEMRAFMETQLQPFDGASPVVNMQTSFRSSPAVLDTVDRIFHDDESRAALAAEEGMRHVAARLETPGWVEVWPLLEEEALQVDAKDTEAEAYQWVLPGEETPKGDSKDQLAQWVVAKIQEILASKALIGADSNGQNAHPVRPDDVLILLRTRSMMPAFIAALDAAGLPHSGADDVNLQEEPVIADLLAAARVAVNANDSAALLHVLRAPFFHVSTAFIEALRPVIRAGRLWETLKTMPQAEAIVATIRTWQRAKSKGIYALFGCILESTALVSESARLMQQAGEEAPEEALKALVHAFLNTVRDYEGRREGGLPQFLNRMQVRGVRYKKQTASAKGIRLMTAHGSKGLEAPIVILPDTMQAMQNASKESALWHDDDSMVVLYQPEEHKTALARGYEKQEKEKQFSDEMRLLYVALTRARERLYIGGIGKRKEPEEAQGNLRTWYDVVAASIAAHPDHWHPYGTSYVHYYAPQCPVQEAPQSLEKSLEVQGFTVPQLPPESPEPRLRPSGQKTDLLAERNEAALFAHGELVHALLEHLPTLPPAERAHWVPRICAHYHKVLSPEQCAQAVEMVERVMLAYPAFFTEATRAEVHFAVRTEKGRIEGVIDRLVITDEGITIVDYKTTRSLPPEGAVPPHYREQIQLYQRAMHALYPEKQVRAFLLWIAQDGIRAEQMTL